MGRRILVVDDEPALRTLMARTFRQQGHEVVEAADGVVAVEIAQSAPQPFDLVVTDSRMPHLDGSHLAHCLREMDPLLPIIQMSGSHGVRPTAKMPQAWLEACPPRVGPA